MNARPGGRFDLTDEQRLNWLRLIRSENVGPATFRDLINHFGTASSALDAVPELAKRGGVAARISIASRDDAQREMDQARKIGARFVGMGEPDYPVMLRGLDAPPPLVCTMGDTSIAASACMAIVGSRNASITGQKLATRFAGELGEHGYTVVSGLARGIDAVAHRASLKTGTIAVYAGGIDQPFPEENVGLAREIHDQGGLLISEMPIGWKPRNIDFPRRNRIIAGLALGVVVIEAAKRSGSLITARLAGEANRLVFAVPGSPLDPRSAGTNRLLKQGAILVTDAADVLDAVRPLEGKPVFAPDRLLEPDFSDPGPPPADSDRERIIELLGPTPTEIDDIIRHTGLRPAQVFLVLLELDLAGRLERHSGGRVSLVSLDP
ncbi:MAG: DNA-processing protein DprA [Nitratireductor sp.]|nr:DNA-processing protein DprA [Nitratireductor sp.]